ncbi:hypothetical protein ACOMHN_033740 [Nucella lapillus]
MAGTRLMLMVAMVMAAMTGIKASGRERVFLMEVLMEKVEETGRRQGNEPNLPNLPDLVDSLGLSELYKYVVDASLGEALSAKGPFTLFAPTNDAFKSVGSWMEKLSKNVTALQAVLTYHVLSGKVMSKDIQDELSVKTLNGQPIRFNIYPADKPKLVTAQCAPIDLKKVDIEASNGVLHELTGVMVPPSGNIVKATVGLKDFSFLVKLLMKAGLVETLSGEGPFTVFAPTDAAFGKVDPKTLNYLLKNTTALKSVLLYHVAKLTYCKAGLVFYKELQMVNGQNVQVSVDGDEVKVNTFPVLPIGVRGSVTNGVIHMLENVLIPPSLHLGHP